jgi:zinc/manganese transport system substrate-binding protein
MNLKILFLLVTVFPFLSSPAWAKLNVVATLPWIGSLARDLGRHHVRVVTLVKPSQDPHFIEAKPSMILEARKADILMFNGLELEIGYLPVLIESSRNAKIQPGESGHLDCSLFVEVIERLGSVNRSQGDVHPLGNPHYHLSPMNIARVATGITERLAALDFANAAYYRKNLSAFQDRLKEYRAQWMERNLRGKKFVVYHKFFEYPAHECGFEILAYIEPKPGIPPSAGHLEKLIGILKSQKPKAILTTVYYGKREVEMLSQKSGVPYLVLPHDVGAFETVKDWFSLMDQILKALE